MRDFAEPLPPIPGRVGVVVAQLGGPRDLGEVRGFIKGIFTDPDAVPIRGGSAVRKTVGSVIAASRAPVVKKYYRLIGSGSPILPITQSQAYLVGEELRSRGHDVVTAVAMRNGRPDTRDAVELLQRLRAEHLVMLPLYPQFTFATVGSAEKELRRVLGRVSQYEPVVLRSWHDHPSYLDLQARLLTETIEQLPEEERDGVAVLVSAHGLPVKVVDKGDPYPEETERTFTEVIKRVPYNVDARLGYQSRTGPIKWIGPGTEKIIDEFAAAGHKTIVMWAVTFVSDHIETLYETDILFRDHAIEAGIETYLRVPVFNDMPEVGPMLADVIEPFVVDAGSGTGNTPIHT